MERATLTKLTIGNSLIASSAIRTVLIVLFLIMGSNLYNVLLAQTTNTSSSYIDPDYTGEKGLRLSTIVGFKAGKSLIDMNGMSSVEQIANYLKSRPSVKVVIEGYAPAGTSDDACQNLSADRAAAVKKSLINTYGISASRLIANGKGVASSEVMQLRKTGDAVLVFEQKPKEDRKLTSQNSRSSQRGNAKSSRTGGKSVASNKGTNSRNGNDAVNAVNNLIGNAIAYGMIGAMTGSDQTCRSCWGSGCSDCNYTGQVYVVDTGLTNALFGAYSAAANAERGQQRASKNTKIKDGYHKIDLGNSETIEGYFKNGKLNGQGKAYAADGTKYVGNFKDDKPNGKGTLTLPDGVKYVGDFVNGTAEGMGTMTWANGDKYVGQFKDNVPHGNGIVYLKEDKTYLKGVWKNNEMVDLIEQGPWNPTASKTSTTKGKTTSTRKK